jgi:hypothetical protein
MHLARFVVLRMRHAEGPIFGRGLPNAELRRGTAEDRAKLK